MGCKTNRSDSNCTHSNCCSIFENRSFLGNYKISLTPRQQRYNKRRPKASSCFWPSVFCVSVAPPENRLPFFSAEAVSTRQQKPVLHHGSEFSAHVHHVPLTIVHFPVLLFWICMFPLLLSEPGTVHCALNRLCNARPNFFRMETVYHLFDHMSTPGGIKNIFCPLTSYRLPRRRQ